MLAAAAREAEDRRLEQVIRVAFYPFRPTVRTYISPDWPDELRVVVAPGTEGKIGLRIDLAALWRTSASDQVLEVGRAIRAAWHAIDPPPDPPNIVRGSD